MPWKPDAQGEYPGSKLTNYLGYTIYVELMEDQFNVTDGGEGHCFITIQIRRKINKKCWVKLQEILSMYTGS